MLRKFSVQSLRVVKQFLAVAKHQEQIKSKRLIHKKNLCPIVLSVLE